MANLTINPFPMKDIEHRFEESDGDYGPPVGSIAWVCNCGSMAFYITKTETICWDCQKEQRF